LFLRGPIIRDAWVRNFLNSSSASNALGNLFAALVVLTIPCALIISLGMAICGFTDRATVGAKASWFLLFVVTWPIGSMVYYFATYRGFIKQQGAGDAPGPRVVSA